MFFSTSLGPMGDAVRKENVISAKNSPNVRMW